MAAPLGQAFHVNGPAIIAIGAQGIAGGLQQLGISEDGVDIVPTMQDDPIMSDAGGARIPHDLQDMGEDAVISFRLVKYDLTVLKSLRARRGIGEGRQNQRGRVIFQNGLGFRITIASDDEPWRFFSCTLRGAQRSKVGTRRTAWDISCYAIPQEIQALGAGWWLYDHTNG